MLRRVLFVPILAVLAIAFVAWSPGPDAAAQTAPAPGEPVFKNVKVLTGVTSKIEMRKLMKEQSAALGVKCTHCHVPGKFELDDKKPKLVAREMLRLVEQLNATTFKDAEEPPAITCWTCHRGETKPQTAVPRSAFDVVDAQK